MPFNSLFNADAELAPAARFLVLVAALVSWPAISIAREFSLEMEAPAFRVTIPSLPEMKMFPHPLGASQPHLRLLGSSGLYTVTVLTPGSQAGMTPEDCARFIVGSLDKRPGVPSQEHIYKARINPVTFVAMYEKLVSHHVHFISAAGGANCVEVHVSREWTSKDEGRSWLRGFADARIEPR